MVAIVAGLCAVGGLYSNRRMVDSAASIASADAGVTLHRDAGSRMGATRHAEAGASKREAAAAAGREVVIENISGLVGVLILLILLILPITVRIARACPVGEYQRVRMNTRARRDVSGGCRPGRNEHAG